MTQPVLPPTPENVRAWTGVTTKSIDEDQLIALVDAEVTNQARMCTVDPYSWDLYQAVLRRCGRALAARGIPLGVTPASAEFGPTRLSAFDGEIERYEGPVRRFGFG